MAFPLTTHLPVSLLYWTRNFLPPGSNIGPMMHVRIQATSLKRIKGDLRKRHDNLFGLLHDMDDIADTAENIGVLLSLRWMELPPQLQDCFWDFLENTLQAMQESKHVVDALEELFESGFSGPGSNRPQKVIHA